MQGKGGALAPPTQNMPNFPLGSRPSQLAAASCEGRGTGITRNGPSAGLKPRPSPGPIRKARVLENPT